MTEKPKLNIMTACQIAWDVDEYTLDSFVKFIPLKGEGGLEGIVKYLQSKYVGKLDGDKIEEVFCNGTESFLEQIKSQIQENKK